MDERIGWRAMAGLIFVMPVPCEQVRTKGISKVGSGLFALFPRRSIFLRRPHDVEVVKQPVFALLKASKEATSLHREILQINFQTCQYLDGYLQGYKMFDAIGEGK